MLKRSLNQYIRLKKRWDALNSTFWFVPTVMAGGAILLAIILLILDNRIEGSVKYLGWLYSGGPEGARAVLATIAGSMISVSGTVFSITIVALTLASSQFGPRLLRKFMQDRGNQIVLGTFIATFIYCLIVLREVRGEDNNVFVPHIAVSVALVLAVISIGVLIYFLHHAAASIQADIVVGDVSNDLDHAIDRLFPERFGQKTASFADDPTEDIPKDFNSNSLPIIANRSGYIQAINDQKLMDIAKSQNLLLSLQHRPGHFAVKGSPLVLVYPMGKISQKLAKQVNESFVIGVQRTQHQDVEFLMDQLVEIALKALSPAINDPFTVIRCIDRLSEAVSCLAKRDIPSPYRYDSQDKLRLITNPITFEGIVDNAFNQIRQSVKISVAVRIRLLEAIAQIATHTHCSDHYDILRYHARMIHRDSLEAILEQRDLRDIERQYFTTLQQLNRATTQ